MRLLLEAFADVRGVTRVGSCASYTFSEILVQETWFPVGAFLSAESPNCPIGREDFTGSVCSWW